MQQMKIEDHLRNEIAAHPQDVMIIVGAGVTLGTLRGTEYEKHASWGKLILHGIRYAVGLGLLSDSEAVTLEALLKHDRPSMWISAAEELSEALGAPYEGDFRAWLREAIEPFGKAIQDRSVLDVLVDLQRRGATLATVNYDSVLETVTGLPPVTWVESSEVERVLRHRAEGILHLHGHWARPDSIVLGTSSYARVVSDEHARAVLESMRMMRTLVFVGHGAGLRDPNWRSFLDWTAEVFRGGELRHYRVVLESDMETLKDPDEQRHRIFSVPYRETYADLGKFLRGLVPASDSPPLRPEPAPEVQDCTTAGQPSACHVLLLVNIGNKSYTTVSARDVVKFAGLPNPVETYEVARTIDLATARARDWREIAQELDQLLAKAQNAASESPEPVTFVIAGRAPLPVFAYLGHRSKLLNGRVLIVNQRGAHWDHVGPFSDVSDFPPSQRVAFSRVEPVSLTDGPGKVGVFVGCSSKYEIDDHDLDVVAAVDGQPLRALHRIVGNFHHMQVPLDQGDLETLTTAFAAVQGAIAKDRASRAGVILAVAGPAWVAFWLGRMLNTNVDNLVDLANFIPDIGYRRALTSRMDAIPWVHGAPRVLALAAEPAEQGLIRAPESLQAMLEAIEQGHSPEAKNHVVTVEATKVEDLVELFGQTQADILHIYAHGTASGGVGLMNAAGRAVVVGPGRLVETLRATNMRVSLAVVFACHATKLVPTLLGVAEIVVATDRTLQHETAIEFIRKLYQELARGRSVQSAFDQAKAHVSIQPDHASEGVVIRSREDVDPADAVFWSRHG